MHYSFLVKRFLRDERGNMSLESALVFPLIMIVIVIMMLAAIYVYQVVFVQYAVLSTAERTAFIWDDKDRLLRTGQTKSEELYGIYDNELMLQLLGRVIPLASSNDTTSVNVSSDSHSSTNDYSSFTSSLIVDKLTLAKQHLQQMKLNVNGQINYSYLALLPRIEITMKQQLSPLIWEQQELFPSPAHTTYRSLVNPTSFIRSVDLVIYYTDQLKKLSSAEQSEWKQKGGKAVKTFSS